MPACDTLARMTIDELVAKQAELSEGDVHLVYLDADKWYVAHTDEERAEGLEAMTDCDLNDWLESFDEPPKPLGLYVALNSWEGWELFAFDNETD